MRLCTQTDICLEEQLFILIAAHLICTEGLLRKEKKKEKKKGKERKGKERKGKRKEEKRREKKRKEKCVQN